MRYKVFPRTGQNLRVSVAWLIWGISKGQMRKLSSRELLRTLRCSYCKNFKGSGLMVWDLFMVKVDISELTCTGKMKLEPEMMMNVWAQFWKRCEGLLEKCSEYEMFLVKLERFWHQVHANWFSKSWDIAFFLELRNNNETVLSNFYEHVWDLKWKND